MTHWRVVFQPDNREISIHQNATLLDAAREAGIIVTTPCGGKGTCGKCALLLAPQGEQILACQYRVDRDLTVTVPPESRFYEHRILAHGIAAGLQVHPTVHRKYRSLDPPGAPLGVAVDLGTTTVVAKLVDLVTGRCLATRAALNPQIRFGDDVVSRIQYGQSPERLEELHRTIVACLNDLLEGLCRRAGVETSALYEASIVGNTTMNHIFLRLPIEQLGRAPYRAWSVEAHDRAPTDVGLRMNPAGNVHCAENIAGFVGADTTAVALAVDIDRIEDRVLVVDIGTNGEIVLGTRAQLLAASCAAGPALEGARIKHGSRAAEGAIEAVVFDEDIVVDTIGDHRPRSICGSGLIDAVAVLADLGVIDPTGRFVPRPGAGGTLPESVTSRILEHAGQPAFCLAWDERTSGPGILLTQKDVREVQLAKAAIRAGIRILMSRMNMKDADIDRVLLAGAFGNYIRPSSAVRIGLLPDVPLDRIQSVGNAAATGAEILLISEECRARAATLARRIQYVEIANEPGFSDVFADAMFLSP
ncbi:MAG: ASKHA domain-containing protein [Planctomycetes bacterium]|jgi:uncharacterized 2Fe-2S/4Fe-4S cluster protein (DUF4445 family)|nr:ASKHA domain-containing protein [Planctomycetota bacterium]